ncbi:hypothetical protein J2755_001610 [Methanohalophilus levihalophilus]|uniref:hypothetical protein n=1 Tax=Methanohalophilus levihalophilus TaxID=1431282 RepID=UPI001AE9E2C3|nr:hypothetical protein [Methanohalophilus levihalophilus]MBP2030662.1 hypothetical protein [Methanohalophilus levihalophilus]
MSANNIRRLDKQYGYITADETATEREVREFTESLLSALEIHKSQLDYIFILARKVWKDRQTLFGTNTRYEYIIIAIAMKTMKDGVRKNDIDSSHEKVSELVKDVFEKNYRKHITSIYVVYDKIQYIFEKDPDTIDFLKKIDELLRSGQVPGYEFICNAEEFYEWIAEDSENMLVDLVFVEKLYFDSMSQEDSD